MSAAPLRLRTGRRVGHTLYEQAGPVPSDIDRFVGSCVTPVDAARIVTAANSGIDTGGETGDTRVDNGLRDRIAAVIAAAGGRYDGADPDTIADAVLPVVSAHVAARVAAAVQEDRALLAREPDGWRQEQQAFREAVAERAGVDPGADPDTITAALDERLSTSRARECNALCRDVETERDDLSARLAAVRSLLDHYGRSASRVAIAAVREAIGDA